MIYNFDELIDRSGTDSIKQEAGTRRNAYLPKDHIPLWVADMDFACAPGILGAMRNRLDHKILGYTDLGVETKKSVLRWMNRRYNWNPSEEEIVFSAGIVAALYAAVDRLTDPGDEVCFLTPAYHPFDQAVCSQDRVPLYSRMINQNGNWTIDFDDLAEKLSRSSCKMFFHCDPQNPTGRVFTEEELKRIGTLCFSNNVFIVSDEIHADLTRAGITHIPIAKLFPEEKRIITCTSPSKSFNIAGNNHAHLFIPNADLRHKWARSFYNGHASPLSNAAVIGAYDESEDWLEELRVYLDESFHMVQAILKTRLPKAVFQIPEGTYLAWVDLSGYGLSEEELKKRISSEGVFVQFGEDFVDNATCFMRINLASPQSVLREGMDRICRALES